MSGSGAPDAGRPGEAGEGSEAIPSNSTPFGGSSPPPPPVDAVWTRRLHLRGAAAGPLRDTTFAVKDLIAVAGCVRGCGNPHWAARQPPQAGHAPCVRFLLEAGSSCVGTTWLDEFAFGLTGENPWGGTPENPAAPGRIPGGSSSGSAVAVARGEVGLALGTDTAGSIRVPASWCGLWGWRPTHGAVPVEGVTPLAPSLDTVGVFAADAALLRRAMAALLPSDGRPAATVPPAPRALLWIPELADLAEPAVAGALLEAGRRLARALGLPLEQGSLAALGLAEAAELLAMLQPIQWAEAEQSLAVLPADLPQGPALRLNRQLVAGRDRRLLEPALERRHHLRRRLDALLGEPEAPTLLLLPVTPCPAPPRGSLGSDRSASPILQRVLTLGALAGLGGLPELSVPGTTVDGLPVGLGLIGPRGGDQVLLEAAVALAAPLRDSRSDPSASDPSASDPSAPDPSIPAP